MLLQHISFLRCRALFCLLERSSCVAATIKSAPAQVTKGGLDTGEVKSAVSGAAHAAGGEAATDHFDVALTNRGVVKVYDNASVTTLSSDATPVKHTKTSFANACTVSVVGVCELWSIYALFSVLAILQCECTSCEVWEHALRFV